MRALVTGACGFIGSHFVNYLKSEGFWVRAVNIKPVSECYLPPKTDIMRDNALININMLEACVRNNVERIFFSSSVCIYPAYRQAMPLVEPLKEEYAVPAEPDSFYGWEKIIGWRPRRNGS